MYLSVHWSVSVRKIVCACVRAQNSVHSELGLSWCVCESETIF